MALSLVVGPAHAGKVALLLERYLGVLDRDPWLIVPNRGDVERVERDLLRRRPALLAGRIGTFDDVFEQIAFGDPERRPVASGTQRTLAVRRAIATTALDTIRDSSASAGFADVLLDALGELESALVDPDAVGGDLGRLARAYRAELRLARALGSRRPPASRGRTDRERSRRLGSHAGLRVRLRGPDGCGVGADRGARAHERTSPCRSRTSPGVWRSPRSRARSAIWLASPRKR